MQCPKCNAQLEEDTIFCGNCGAQIQPVQASGATVSDAANELFMGANSPTSIANYNRPYGQVQPPLRETTQVAGRMGRIDMERPTPVTPPPPRIRTRRFVFIAALVVLLIVLILGGTLALLRRNDTAANGAVATHANGTVSFSDSTNGQGHTDTLRINISGLNKPSTGTRYDAWLVNEAKEQTLALGTLNEQGQTFTLNFSDQGTNLLGQGNKLEITLEQGNVTLPTGKILLAGTFPPKAFVHIKHLLFSFPTTPGKIGLLPGLLAQVQLLNSQAILLKSIANNGNRASIQCAAQSIVDIAEGAQGAHTLPLASDCASLGITVTGDGFGILGSDGYINTSAAHASLAATQSDSTQNIKTHAGEVEIAMSNVRGWANTVDQDANALLANPTNVTKVQEMVTLSNQMLNGVDSNGDGQIDPVAGEAGTIPAYSYAHLMATLPLTPISD